MLICLQMTRRDLSTDDASQAEYRRAAGTSRSNNNRSLARHDSHDKDNTDVTQNF
jgi:hypothetical protein